MKQTDNVFLSSAKRQAENSQDWRVVQAVNVAERFLHGMATRDEMVAAWGTLCSAISWKEMGTVYWPEVTTPYLVGHGLFNERTIGQLLLFGDYYTRR
ncbi:hypothetical protein [Methylocystis heyeri]|uniref:Uncharacterized protein n=1 Tax=Methylocystis heyeri TaxID=391905 RepID=A0A6B8KI12_9HYPH|nr:hypothetical protein [Methylocystis heyeri]QGM46153.1 hypothetical protein H2LOC_010845 [Methylocystis heyeri]